MAALQAGLARLAPGLRGFVLRRVTDGRFFLNELAITAEGRAALAKARAEAKEA